MPMIDEIRRVALFTSGVAELSKNRAEQIVKGMVKSGDIRKDQVSTRVKGLMEVSRDNRIQLVGLIRSEIQNQVKNLGLATKRDLERVERRVARLESSAKGTKGTTKKTTRKSTVARPRAPEPLPKPSRVTRHRHNE